MPIGDEHTSSHCAVDPHAPALNPELWDASDTVPSDELRARINAGATAVGLGELEPLDINDAPAGAGLRAIGTFRARRERSASLVPCPIISARAATVCA